MGKIGIHRNFDGDYTVKSNGKKATFRLIVHQGRGKEYLVKGTNLDVNRSIVVKWECGQQFRSFEIWLKFP